MIVKKLDTAQESIVQRSHGVDRQIQLGVFLPSVCQCGSKATHSTKPVA